MSIVKVNWSGGKDSTAALILHLKNGDKVKAVCYVPMLTNDIPLISKDHYRFINEAANIFRQAGAEVYMVSGINYVDFVHRRSSAENLKGAHLDSLRSSRKSAILKHILK